MPQQNNNKTSRSLTTCEGQRPPVDLRCVYSLHTCPLICLVTVGYANTYIRPRHAQPLLCWFSTFQDVRT